ncbi:MAG: YhcG family protein [Desulfotignum sp.]
MTDKDRKFTGRAGPDAGFPAPVGKGALPADYAAVLEGLKERIQSERLHVVLSANAAMLLLYWDIGRIILERQEQQGWGARVIDRLSHDLKQAFPDMKGLSPRNLLFMRSFAAAYPEPEIVKQVVSKIPWGHNIRILQKVKHPENRLWYIRQTMAHGWSRNILTMQIESRAHQRQGRTTHNFDLTLPPSDSDMAAQVFKDPYLFDFLGTADPRNEREVEQALMDHIQQFLLEMGVGFAFVGRQVPLEVGDQDFRLDLLFYHLKLRCFVVVELKAVPFDPAFVGKLNFYLSAVDDLLRHPHDQPTIGLLLCKSKNKLVAEYALRGFSKPMSVAQWQTRLTDTLPDELKGSLPSIEEIEAELGGEDEE